LLTKLVAKPAILLIAACMMWSGLSVSASHAAGDTRSLKLYFVHTGEKAVITFKRNGKFDAKGLQQLNRFLRDWRRNQPTKMDPRLFDLIWEVYRKSGSREYIHVVSAFRSPQTNSMLRSRSKGVAEKSQHMLGKAMDFYLPDVKLANLRAIGMKMQVGGVGFYPTSGSPFVHMDVGNVRSWPRMSRQELVRLFPDGKSMHLPADGNPLPGYQQALADHKRRAGSVQIEVADTTTTTKRKGFFAALFGGGADEEEETGQAAEEVLTPTRKRDQPITTTAEQEPVMTAALETEKEKDINAPVPLVRPAFKETMSGNMTALLPTTRNVAEEALQAALPATPETEQNRETFVDLTAYRIPVPELLGKRNMAGDAEVEANSVMTASVDPAAAAAAETGELAFVPVPGTRPALAEALLAQAAEAKVDEKKVEQASLSPDVIAALEKSEARPVAGGVTIPAAEAAEEGTEDYQREAAELARATGAAENDYTTDEPSDSDGIMQMAALDTEAKPVMRSVDFGDAFDQPKGKEARAEPVNGEHTGSLPGKGKRPQKADAEADAATRDTIRTEPKLTKQIISQWALSKARFEVISKPVKAPRFVSRTMRAQPTSVYATGFTAATAEIDPGRFSGSAVNFMEVRKFNTQN